MKILERESPAKINIGLNIIKKRNDGYHNIETIFYPIKLSDRIRIKVASSSSFESTDNRILNNSDNLILRAKSAVEREINQKLNCEIALNKNIPVGAGLGGGSSNAATTLLMLNEIYSLKLDNKKLNTLALHLGSDVPFFLNPVPSIGTSRGEILKEINFTIKDPILIVNPGVHISTKWAYENILPKKSNYISNMNVTESAEKSFTRLSNDFEEIVFRNYPEIKEIKNLLLEAGAQYASMSGSGSTVFAIFASLKVAREQMKIFSKNYFTYLNISQ